MAAAASQPTVRLPVPRLRFQGSEAVGGVDAASVSTDSVYVGTLEVTWKQRRGWIGDGSDEHALDNDDIDANSAAGATAASAASAAAPLPSSPSERVMCARLWYPAAVVREESEDDVAGTAAPYVGGKNVQRQFAAGIWAANLVGEVHQRPASVLEGVYAGRTHAVPGCDVISGVALPVAVLLAPRAHPVEYLTVFAEGLAAAGFVVWGLRHDADFDDGFPGASFIREREAWWLALLLSQRGGFSGTSDDEDHGVDAARLAPPAAVHCMDAAHDAVWRDLWRRLDLRRGVTLLGHGLGSVSALGLACGSWSNPLQLAAPARGGPSTAVDWQAAAQLEAAQWWLRGGRREEEEGLPCVPRVRCAVLLDYWRTCTNATLEALGRGEHAPLLLVQSSHWHHSPSLMVLDLIKQRIADANKEKRSDAGGGGGGGAFTPGLLVAKFTEGSNHDFTDLPFLSPEGGRTDVPELREVAHQEDSPMLLGPGTVQGARARCLAAVELAASFASRCEYREAASGVLKTTSTPPWLDTDWLRRILDESGRYPHPACDATLEAHPPVTGS